MGDKQTTEKEKSENISEEQDEIDEITCPECEDGGNVVATSSDETMCEDCGLILEEDNIDRGPEWRAFNQQERESKSRVGSPTTQTMHDKGLTTTIDWKDKDSYGRSISSRKRSQMKRLRKWQERIRTKDAGERNLQFALSEIDRMSSALGIPRSVREVASVMYRRALEEDLIRGRSIEGVSTACLYIACRKQNIPRSLEEISQVSRVDKKEIGRTYTYISRTLELKIEPVNPKDYVARYCNELELSSDVEYYAKKIIDKTENLLSGKSPTGFAAAAIYAASLLMNEKRTQKEVAEVANVTEVTIRNRYQEQIEEIGIKEDE